MNPIIAYPDPERINRFTDKPIPGSDKRGGLFSIPTKERCENNEAHGFLVNDCLRCGAPVCCPQCCAEDAK